MRTKLKQLGQGAAFFSRRDPANVIAVARQILLSLAFAAAVGPVCAADLPSRLPSPVFTPPPPAPFTWTGPYIGVNAGYGLDHFAFPYSIHAPGAIVYENRGGITARGAVVGGQIGFNYQFQSDVFGLPVTNIVAGVEIDSSWSGIRGDTTVYGSPFHNFGSATFGSKFEVFGTARGRIGYAFGRFLPYFTAGFSYATVNTYYSVTTNAPFSIAGSSTATRSGIFPHVGVLGIGLEYALTNNLTVKGEYLYDFINARYTRQLTPVSAIDFGTRAMYHIGRIGLNYKFDWLSPPAAVIAKY
jgi:outer membrane immunogenic protein